MTVKHAPPRCEYCGQPASNWNRGEYTGHHTDRDQCLRELGQRISALENGRRDTSLDEALNSGDGSYKP